jgi:cold shock CspA family protein
MALGTVTEFDEQRGLGAVVTADGATYPFHCAQITDGTRTIDVGQQVRFTILARFGRYEAGTVDKLP